MMNESLFTFIIVVHNFNKKVGKKYYPMIHDGPICTIEIDGRIPLINI